jgi:hypothetical protein
MSEQHLAARDFAVLPALADQRRAVALKVESWLETADAIIAGEHFDSVAALSLVEEIRSHTGPGSINFAARQAIGYLQAASRLSALSTDKWQRARALARNTTSARQRFEALRNDLARRASRS